MPYANNQGVRIHYELEGNGPPLVLQHGLSNSLESWRENGYVEALKDDYRLILVDARGHGASDKPHDPKAYQARMMPRDVLAVLDDLNIEAAHYFGYSMGGHIGFALAKYASQRFHSLILGGMSPYRQEAEEQFLSQILQRLEGGSEDFIAVREESLGRPLPPEQKARLLANDHQALIAALQSGIMGSMEDVPPSMILPCLVFAGDADPMYAGAKAAVSHMLNATFVSFPGLDHGQTNQRSDLVLPHVTKFLAEVTRALV